MSLIVASDYMEFAESGRSFIVDLLVDQGAERDRVMDYYLLLGTKEQAASQAYIECFETFDVEEEFDRWSEEEGNFQRCKEAIEQSLLQTAQSMEWNGIKH